MIVRTYSFAKVRLNYESKKRILLINVNKYDGLNMFVLIKVKYKKIFILSFGYVRRYSYLCSVFKR